MDIHRQGELVIPCRFEWTSDFDRFDEAWAREKGRLGRIDRMGKWVKGFNLHQELEPSIYGFSSTLIIVINDKDKQGCLDRNDRWIIPLQTCHTIEVHPAAMYDSKRHYYSILIRKNSEPLMAKGRKWLADHLLFLSIFSPNTGIADSHLIYDDHAGRVIWMSSDRERDVWWGTGLALIAAGALFIAWRGRRISGGSSQVPRENVRTLSRGTRELPSGLPGCRAASLNSPTH